MSLDVISSAIGFRSVCSDLCPDSVPSQLNSLGQVFHLSGLPGLLSADCWWDARVKLMVLFSSLSAYSFLGIAQVSEGKEVVPCLEGGDSVDARLLSDMKL